MADHPSIIYDWLSPDDIPAAMTIELQGFPVDEAASLETFKYRQSNAGDLFLGAYLTHEDSRDRELVGYVCSTLSPAESLTHESMSTHVPLSASVCLHSVCVSPSHRRKKIGVNLLKEYISRLEAARKDGRPYQRILLITHEPLRQFYEQAGFEWLGKSSVVHGSKPWYEMRKVLGSSTAQPIREELPEPRQIPAGVWDALQHSTKARPLGRAHNSFPGGILDLVEPHTAKQGVSVNKFDLLCPRPACGSIILKRGVAEWVERASVVMEPPSVAAKTILPPLPAPPATCQWWLITPSPMQFENIGFSRPVQQNPAGPKLKLLACAECDLGPLGWSEEGGREFWLACARVSYRA
ncbi:putative acetyltransferase (GNAT) domain containing protein [Lyophyllum shimeji]|uniref:Acetyltransferase (GNAT) domain containing protein n=1 Tax=Lyophyllum shimeji TaxID=47721 RepID=A0A9P3PTE6_LYOSH|nr:putative acetyltransferase (GNAT) domain containing protein [Lyophyllum shimeji]